MQQVFSGINGQELIEIACVRLRRILEDTNEFGVARTYPCFDLTVEFKLSAYPRDTPDLEAKFTVQEKAAGFKPAPNEKQMELSRRDVLLGVGAKIKSKDAKGKDLPILEIEPGIAPDQVRADHGLPVFKPTEVQGVGVVEKA